MDSLPRVQTAADDLAEASVDSRNEASEDLAKCILERFQHEYYGAAAMEVFSTELPMNIQRFVVAVTPALFGKRLHCLS